MILTRPTLQLVSMNERAEAASATAKPQAGGDADPMDDAFDWAGMGLEDDPVDQGPDVKTASPPDGASQEKTDDGSDGLAVVDCDPVEQTPMIYIDPGVVVL
jgi:hypothetical protein